MIYELVLIICAVVVFAVYNITMVALYDVPSSLSETFYLLNDERNGYGCFFTAMMWAVAFLLLPALVGISDRLGAWECYCTPIAFAAVASIYFVGAEPAFRNLGEESKVHSVAAKLAAFFALAWCLVACWRIMYVPIIACVITLAFGYKSKTLRLCATYWLELAAYSATFVTLAVECIWQMLMA